MFDRFIRLAKARSALREQRLEDALQLARDPAIEADRRAEAVRVAAVAHIGRRAEQRLQAGDLDAAEGDLRFLRRHAEGPALEPLAAAIAAARAAHAAAAARRRAALVAAQHHLDRGELDAAAEVIAALGPDRELADVRQVRDRLAERRAAGQRLAAAAAELLAAGDLAGAIDAHVRAAQADVAAAAAGRDALLTAAAGELQSAVATRLAEGDLAGALAAFQYAAARLPQLAAAPVLQPVVATLGQAVTAALAAAGSATEALSLLRRVRSAALPCDGPLSALLDSAAAVASGAVPDDRPPEGGPAMAAVLAAATAIGAPALAAWAHGALASSVAGERCLAEARAAVDRGELDVGRRILAEFLSAVPLHEAARRELELIDQRLADLDRSLADLRGALREGRLAEVCSRAMAMVGSARIVAEAQQILAEARARSALVDRGLDEIRVALHGRLAATREGVRHCLLRLRELTKVQVDHVELPRVIAAVAAELDAIVACEQAAASLQQGDLDAALPALGRVLAARGSLLGSERLDARLCEFGDRLQHCAERALRSGQLASVDRILTALDALVAVDSDYAPRIAAMRAAMAERRAAAQVLVARARVELEGRDLAAAEALAKEAVEQWAEDPAAKCLAAELAQVRRHEETLQAAQVLAGERDYYGANRKLDGLGGVPAMLRTRVYDMKRDLVRAQGLDHAFLLRVDEGGEHLVLRGETVTIGNVRQATADLPVLANLAGRHASVRRSMSFHGGMQDTIVAEDGPVHVRGAAVRTHALASGDRVQLGPALQLAYHQPTARSLTSAIVLHGGFQVAGTDRILLMKDRGRDGRILLGAGPDVHVRVAGAVGEVEIYANPAGAMRVAADSGGTIDGQPFRGEHPVSAGQLVVAAGISFVLLPWRPTR